MKYWCRFCRKWVLHQHSDSTCEDEKGQNYVRYHPQSPLCGDVWRLRDGSYAVIDYKDSFCTGFTFSDGERVLRRAALNYTDSVRRFFESEEAELVSAFEDVAYPLGIDHRGWTDSKYKPDAADKDGSRSVDFLKKILMEAQP